ncbi:cerebellin 10 [Pseudorasbora parva]|uniref:cerebellin 10 n=1 Tax=Pseudorasbora parva TaxID=51549 RepID=UPI00351ED2CC
MLLFITVLTLNVWAIPADDLLTPNINILEELRKIKIMETRMESMEKELERLRTENTAQAKKLEEFHVTMNDRKIKMDEIMKQNEVSKVAFSVSLSSSNGPHSSLQTLMYKHIFLNTGDGYDANTGIFTAPMKGVYVFMVFSKAHGSQDKAVVAGLFKNGQHEISTYARQDGGFIGSSNGVSLLLEKGDKICVNLYPGYWIFDNEHHHSTFSGHLLFPM